MGGSGIRSIVSWGVGEKLGLLEASPLQPDIRSNMYGGTSEYGVSKLPEVPLL